MNLTILALSGVGIFSVAFSLYLAYLALQRPGAFLDIVDGDTVTLTHRAQRFLGLAGAWTAGYAQAHLLLAPLSDDLRAYASSGYALCFTIAAAAYFINVAADRFRRQWLDNQLDEHRSHMSKHGIPPPPPKSTTPRHL